MAQIKQKEKGLFFSNNVELKFFKKLGTHIINLGFKIVLICKKIAPFNTNKNFVYYFSFLKINKC